MREVLYEGRILRLEREDGRWEIVRHADAVAVLCRDDEGRVLGVWQQRPAIAARSWEIPAGLIDAGETPLAAAERELAEEAGLGGRLRELTRFYPSPGFSDELVHLYAAEALVRVDGHERDADEVLELEWRDPAATWAAIADGTLASSSVTVLALALTLGARAVTMDPEASAAAGAERA